MPLRPLALVVLLLAGFVARAEPPAPAPPAAPAPKLLGRIADNRYHAPADIYSVAVPVLHGDAATILDNGEIVVFKDKISTLLTIAAFPLPPIAQFDYDTDGPREFLINFFRDNIVRDYRQAFPDSSIESARFLPDIFGGALVAFTLLPGGSAFGPPEPVNPAAPPPVAKRGHFVFVRDGRIYVIAVELAERVTQPAEYKLTTAEEDHILFDRLVTVTSALRFGAMPAPAAGAQPAAADQPSPPVPAH